MLAIASNAVFEFYTLGFAERPTFRPREKAVCWITSIVSLVAGSEFTISEQLMVTDTALGLCCKDEWRIPSDAGIRKLRFRNRCSTTLPVVQYWS